MRKTIQLTGTSMFIIMIIIIIISQTKPTKPLLVPSKPGTSSDNHMMVMIIMQGFSAGKTLFIQGAVAASPGACESLVVDGETRQIHGSAS
jgi:hypothetical protein